MDITETLQAVTTLTDEQKQYFIDGHAAGSLTTEEVEELKEHLLKSVSRLAEERAVAEDVLDSLTS
ncbi:MAG: hypothetical protein O2904_04955 [bacterium]|nr:hypothetical protein [bacterium]